MAELLTAFLSREPQKAYLDLVLEKAEDNKKLKAKILSRLGLVYVFNAYPAGTYSSYKEVAGIRTFHHDPNCAGHNKSFSGINPEGVGEPGWPKVDRPTGGSNENSIWALRSSMSALHLCSESCLLLQ